ncbi:secreted coth spore-coat protein domain-containing protein [Phycomyces blakesleeanus]|uniref:Secreted coth spore-coat protein domain-containing protein n=1 Tax=Phycomyces blakesleeanus TaxID=4837 RepID=A0ABR3BF97_PHYBL
MKFTSLSFIAFAFLVACTEASPVTFRVIAPGATGNAQVSIDGKVTDLTASDADVPYFTGSVEAGTSGKYKYVVNGQAESFDRTLETGRNATRNDFFSRPVTYANIPKLPWPITENPQWTRGGSNQEMWDDNYIPSIFMTGDAAELSDLVANVPATMSTVKFTFIGPETVRVYNGCSFGIHGAGKKKNNAKQSWKWSLPAGQTIDNRNYIKIRHMEEDPTQLREKLYADILRAMGTYANQANMVRLFINGEGYGTFNMLDDVADYSYIDAMFYNGNPPATKGPLFDGASGASFAYSAEDDFYSAFKPNVDSPQDYTAIKPLALEFSQTDVTSDAAIEAFSKKFDVDQFLRFMVMEYLTGHWDGYWQEQTNDGAYQDPTDSKWYYLGQDYDATFGVNLGAAEGKEFTKVSYTTYPTRYPGAVMINRLLENPSIKTKFETYIKNTVSVLFNNVTLTNRVLAYHEFVLPDLLWDRSIVQKSPGINFGWTADQVSQNLYEAVSGSGGEGGGAAWGLIEWIVSMSQAVATEFKVDITTVPVGPPGGSAATTPSTSASVAASVSKSASPVSATGATKSTGSSSSSKDTDGDISAASKDGSGAFQITPKTAFSAIMIGSTALLSALV